MMALYTLMTDTSAYVLYIHLKSYMYNYIACFALAVYETGPGKTGLIYMQNLI